MSKKNFAQGPVIEHIWADGATKETLPVTGSRQREMTLTYSKDRVGNRPLKATGIRLLITGHDVAADTAVDISPAEYGQLLDYIELDTKILGLLADKNVTTGPVLWNFITPFLRRGISGRGPTKLSGHSGAGTTDNYFRIEFELPFTNESADRPTDTARLLSELQGATLRVAANVAGAFGTAHTLNSLECTVVTDTVIDYGRKPWELGAVLNYTRYMRTANSGTTQIMFDNVGQATGASGTNSMDGSKFVAAVLMGNALGLPGPDDFTDTTRLGVPLLAQDDVINPELQQSAMVSALDLAVPADKPYNATWPLVLQLSEGSPGTLNSLPFLIIIASGANARTTQLPVIKDNLTINLVKTSMPGSGQWYLYAIEVRDYAANLAELVIKSLGFDPNKTTRKTSDGTDPKSAIESGRVSKLRYQGQPVQMQ